tara:strand:- start:1787 stop:2029 length:243 start_codon:yes stop_codon:yes gene_type:complete
MTKSKLQNLFLKEFKEKKNLKNFSKISMSNYSKWDSISHIKLIIRIEKEYKIKFKINEIFKLNNFHKISNYLKKHAKNKK